jgi:hypothetical protein
MAYDNTNSGATFKNDNKVEDWQYDFTGELNVEGALFFLDSKWYPPQNGKKGYFRHKVKRKQPKQDSAPSPAPVASADAVDDPFSSDVPW